MNKIEEFNTEPGMHIDQQVDLLEYLNAILRAKFRILIFAVVGAAVVFGASKMVKDQYSASAVLAININENPGGVAPRSYRGSDTLSLIEHDFIVDAAADNEKDRLIARMTSAGFAEIFISENNLLPYIFSEQWDDSGEVWIDNFEPSMGEAVSFVRQNMLAVEVVEKTGLMLVHFKSTSPTLSADLANKFWPRFNTYMRELQLAELEQRREYLQSRLDTVSNIEMQRSIYRLMETQLASEALLHARTNYPLEEIQPAVVPRFKSYPKRKAWAVTAFVGLAFLGVVIVLAAVIIKKLRSSLSSYQLGSEQVTTQAPKQSKFKRMLTSNNSVQAGANGEPQKDIFSASKVDHPGDELDEWIDKS